MNARPLWLSRLCVLLVTLLTAFAATVTEANPPKRVSAFKQLPDWTGVWNEAAVTPDAGGNLDDPSVLTLILGHPPYQPQQEAEYQAKVKGGPREGGGSCQIDFPTMLQYPTPLEFTVTPEETVVSSSIGATRHIYTDGKPHTPDDIIVPSLMGDSVGRWEGDTLVVDTTARRPGLVQLLVVFSEKAHFKEHIRRLDRDTLEDRLTVDDPAFLTKPWVVVVKFTRVTNTRRLAPFECDQNDRYRIIDGKGQIAPVATASP
jgi:hypothetical protein